MTPRTASLRVAHQGNCPNATKTALSSVGRGSGCKCSPSYYTFHRGRDGKPDKGSRIKSRAVAERALRKLQVEIDERRVGQTRAKDVTFDEWADEFERITEARVGSGDLKPRTLTGYRFRVHKEAQAPRPQTRQGAVRGCRAGTDVDGVPQL